MVSRCGPGCQGRPAGVICRAIDVILARKRRATVQGGRLETVHRGKRGENASRWASCVGPGLDGPCQHRASLPSHDQAESIACCLGWLSRGPALDQSWAGHRGRSSSRVRLTLTARRHVMQDGWLAIGVKSRVTDARPGRAEGVVQCRVPCRMRVGDGGREMDG